MTLDRWRNEAHFSLHGMHVDKMSVMTQPGGLPNEMSRDKVPLCLADGTSPLR